MNFNYLTERVYLDFIFYPLHVGREDYLKFGKFTVNLYSCYFTCPASQPSHEFENIVVDSEC